LIILKKEVHKKMGQVSDEYYRALRETKNQQKEKLIQSARDFAMVHMKRNWVASNRQTNIHRGGGYGLLAESVRLINYPTSEGAESDEYGFYRAQTCGCQECMSDGYPGYSQELTVFRVNSENARAGLKKMIEKMKDAKKGEVFEGNLRDLEGITELIEVKTDHKRRPYEGGDTSESSIDRVSVSRDVAEVLILNMS
jgi:hypothetical protein